MAPFVLVHLGVILVAVRGGLTTAEILARTQGNWGWIGFYGLFVLCAAVHVPIGLRNIAIEWLRVPRRVATVLGALVSVGMLVMGLKAVASVGGLG
jgi:fumarate reductase subunit C